MDESTNLSAGLSKRQLVLYGTIALLGLVFFGSLIYFTSGSVSDTPTVAMNSPQVASSSPAATTPTSVETTAPKANPFTFEVVATPALRQKGLSGRTEIAPNYGMFFVFPIKDRYGFWMKDMRTPIDIIWLSDTGTGVVTIIGVEESVSPTTYPATFIAPEPVRYVLETRAGETRRLGWEVGTRLTLPSGIPVPQ